MTEAIQFFLFYSNPTDRINCTAVNLEYNGESSRCQDIFTPCITQLTTCPISEFCSDECRSIYFKVLLCMNETTDLVRLSSLNLLCATSADPRYSNSTCLNLVINPSLNQVAHYGYLGDCFGEIRSKLGFDCSPACRNTLLLYTNDCCSVNDAVASVVMREGLIDTSDNATNLYTHQLWEHCQVESPRICPTLPCPTSPTVTDGVPEHHMNSLAWPGPFSAGRLSIWLILLVATTLSTIFATVN